MMTSVTIPLQAFEAAAANNFGINLEADDAAAQNLGRLQESSF